MASIGNTVGSKRMAMVEALVLNHRSGLTVPQAVRASKVPRTTAYRILADLKRRGLVEVVAKAGKADVFKLNAGRPEVVGLAKSVNAYTHYVAESKARAHAPDQGPAGHASFKLRTPVDFTDRLAPGFQVTRTIEQAAEA